MSGANGHGKAQPTPPLTSSVWPAFHPLNPNTYDQSVPFDILELLASPKGRAYAGEEWLTISQLPNYLRTSIDRVRAHTQTTTKPPMGAVVSTCILHGTTFFSNKPDIRQLIDLKQRLDLTTDISGACADEMSAWFRAFPVGVADTSMSGSKRINIRVTKAADDALHTLAGEIGLGVTALTVMTLCVALYQQEEAILPDHAKLMKTTVDAFLLRTYARRRVAEVLLDVLG